jgi:hypothetical protein
VSNATLPALSQAANTVALAAQSDIPPVNYTAAKAALAECERIDECKSWSDKALALKSCAKQVQDGSLERLAQHIRDRAVRRGGELPLEIQADTPDFAPAAPAPKPQQQQSAHAVTITTPQNHNDEATWAIPSFLRRVGPDFPFT